MGGDEGTVYNFWDAGRLAIAGLRSWVPWRYSKGLLGTAPTGEAGREQQLGAQGEADLCNYKGLSTDPTESPGAGRTLQSGPSEGRGWAWYSNITVLGCSCPGGGRW